MFPVTFTGFIAKEPEIRFTTGGVPVVTLVVGTKERKYDSAANGWTDGPVSFWDVDAWRDQAQEIYEKLHKGDTILVHGKMLKDPYEVDGQKRSRVKITADHVGLSMKWGAPKEERNEPARFAPKEELDPPF